jgi:hypothetical protein
VKAEAEAEMEAEKVEAEEVGEGALREMEVDDSAMEMAA